ncbi:glutamate 5-kinase [Priestia koreensis]|uniref:glutamate 5-kinase n=1 Tax=Priestia koreensis TaxID=284581 RepID=UPI00203B9A43|nr:glutamate 5-kinase [Priestia koreensis]MCM3005402.1 glutamate 5-kinase [Priestia koreensis]
MKKQRIVVKIGSSSLTTSEGKLSYKKLEEHVKAIKLLKNQGHEVILISSGAVAAGFSALRYATRPKTLAAKQASAAVGQGLLMEGYNKAFAPYHIPTAQLLLTRGDFYEQYRFRNIYATITELLKGGAVPIINENDSVVTDELTFGDNDMLSALVSGFLHANALIILTDINGLYDENPFTNPHAKKYSFIPSLTEELLALGGDSESAVGTGGMRSKLLAAQTALSLGVSVFVGKGNHERKLLDIIEGKGDGTYIGSPFQTQMETKKQWIAHHAPIAGKIRVDVGAEKALIYQHKSLLPAGIEEVSGTFRANEIVEVVNKDNKLIGKGQVSYSSTEIDVIKGLSSFEAKTLINGKKAAVIHRDQWITVRKEGIKNE